jgi:PAS domain S-box-containing protein
MTDLDFQLLAIRDPRLAVHAASALPAWLWSTDGARILWANPVAVRLFGAPNTSVLAAKPIGPADPHRRQVMRLAGRLSPSGATRLERLSGFGATLGRLVTCACTRLTFDGDAAILVVATEFAGRTMPLAERLARLVEAFETPAVAFSGDGAFAGASDSSKALPNVFNATADLVTDSVRREVMTEGRADMRSDLGRIALHRVGIGADTGIVALISPVIVVPPLVIEPAPETLVEQPDPPPEIAPVVAAMTPAETSAPPDDLPAATLDPPEPDQILALLADAPEGDALPDISAADVEGIGDDAPVVEQSTTDLAQPQTDDSANADVEPPSDPTAAGTPADDIPAAPAAIEPAVTPHAPEPAPDAHQSPEHLLANEPPLSPRRHPLRFMWQMDEHGRFSFGSDEFTRLIGIHTAAAFGRLWSEINDVLGLDPDGKVAAAIATRDTWSGITLDWPVDGTGARLPVELSGLPIHDRNQQFRGYRGFGVCRDVDGLAQLAAQRRDDLLYGTQQSTGPAPAHETAADNHATVQPERETETVTEPTSPPDEPDRAVEPPINVVPFRPAGDAKSPTLTPVENNAFAEIARQLSARLEGDNTNAAPAAPDIAADDLDAAMEINTDEAPAAPQPDTPPDVEAAALMQDPPADHVGADELSAILDTAAEGILIFDGEGKIHSCNRSAEALFGLSDSEINRRPLADLFAPESPPAILDYLHAVRDASVASLLDHGRDVLAHARDGGAIPLSVTIGRTRADGARYFAIFRDRAPLRPNESDVLQTRRSRERIATAKADVLARISHEVRTPLNAIIGFAEVMIEERFGTLGNERYVDYMKDIRASGERVIAIIDDLLNLSRIESGKLDLSFASQDLNGMLEQCVAAMQAHANRERIIIRTSLAHALPSVNADARALRQIALNLIGNSIHLANAGGQVIVSTAVTDHGDVVLRVRDTGHGMNDNEIAAAMAPFRTPAAADLIDDNSGSNLSLTKALVEANRAQFHIKSAPNSGTLIEIVFSRAAAIA